MVLSTCRECKTEVSPNAVACPRCGAPYPARPSWNGTGYEWKSGRTVAGFPLVHIAFGRDARGRLRVARGVIAVGQFGIGAVCVAQFGVGLVFGLGQFIVAPAALAQIAVGFAAVGQVVVAGYGLAQAGWAVHLWSPGHADPEAAAFFKALWRALSGRGG